MLAWLYQLEIGFVFHTLTFKRCNQLLDSFLISHGMFFFLPFRLVAPPRGIMCQVSLVHGRRQDAAQRVV